MIPAGAPFLRLKQLAATCSIILFADGLLVRRPDSRNLLHLNSSAATLWCLLPDCADETDLLERYRSHFGLDEPQAVVDWEQLSAQWLHHFHLPEPQDETPELYPDSGFAGSADLPEVCRAAIGRCRLRFLGAVPQEVHGIFPPESDPGGSTGHVDLGVQKDADGFAICRQGRLVARQLANDQLLPHLVTLSFLAVCEAHRGDFLLHTALLRRAGQTLLLAGESGSGKSTLAAALTAHGWTCHSDELVALAPVTGSLTGLPLPLVLKSGSVPVLRSRIPGLPDLPEHRRPDGQRARYLPCRPDPGGSDKVTLVLPRYHPDVENLLVPLEPISALQRLAATGSSDRQLTDDDIHALAGLVQQASCLRLDFSSLDRAVELLTELRS
ncbi:MAG: hypothetical protein Tsb0017_05880 [Geothermobacteraceae bacterium]